MTDKEFTERCRELAASIMPAPGQPGFRGNYPVDANLLREILARHGGARLFRDAYFEALVPFSDAYRELQHEAALASSVGHSYPMEDDDDAIVEVRHLRRAFELVMRERG